MDNKEEISPKLDKNMFRLWMLGMLMSELNVDFSDRVEIEKLSKCTKEIIRFAEENNLLAEKNKIGE